MEKNENKSILKSSKVVKLLANPDTTLSHKEEGGRETDHILKIITEEI